MSRTSVAPTARYLNIYQRKMETIINETVQMLQHESVDNLLMDDFFKHNPNNYQVTQSGSK
jgi:hypothetical protein